MIRVAHALLLSFSASPFSTAKLLISISKLRNNRARIEVLVRELAAHIVWLANQYSIYRRPHCSEPVHARYIRAYIKDLSSPALISRGCITASAARFSILALAPLANTLKTRFIIIASQPRIARVRALIIKRLLLSYDLAHSLILYTLRRTQYGCQREKHNARKELLIRVLYIYTYIIRRSRKFAFRAYEN